MRPCCDCNRVAIKKDCPREEGSRWPLFWLPAGGNAQQHGLPCRLWPKHCIAAGDACRPAESHDATGRRTALSARGKSPPCPFSTRSTGGKAEVFSGRRASHPAMLRCIHRLLSQDPVGAGMFFPMPCGEKKGAQETTRSCRTAPSGEHRSQRASPPLPSRLSWAFHDARLRHGQQLWSVAAWG